ncbi:MAG: TldD/PmbA family protein, partial [Bdellovibrionota bacterium]
MKSDLKTHPCLKEAQKLIEKLKPDHFELYFEISAKTKIEAKDGAVDSLTRSEDQGLSIRILKNQRVGFSFTTSMEKAAIQKAVESAFSIAKLLPADPYAGFELFASDYPEIAKKESFDSEGLKAPIDQKVVMAKNLESLCKKADSRIKTVRPASLSESHSEVQMMDSRGKTISHTQTFYVAYLNCIAEENGDSQVGAEVQFSHHLSELKIKNVATQAAKWATELLGAGASPTMSCPAIFRNSVVSELIEFISSSFSAEEIDKGRSMLADKMGQTLFSKKVNLIDDGLLKGGAATSPFDGEGVASRKTKLVSDGKISAFLYDTYYSKKLKQSPTGNATRGIKSPPSIGTTNFYLEPGKTTPEKLIEQIKKGVLITDLMGVHTANPVTGDFSLGASGILIENGKLTRPVRGFAVAGNVLDVFRKITDISNDLRFFGGIGAPSVC